MSGFNAWNRFKIQLNLQDKPPVFFNEREIWWASLGLNIGQEIDGKNRDFGRPVLILKKYSKNLCFVLPLTTQINQNKEQFPINIRNKAMAIVLSQGKTISSIRLSNIFARLTPLIFDKIMKNFKNQF